MKDLKIQLHLTVHSSKKSVEEIADECGISTSYLYRSCLEGDSGCKFPLELLIPLMRSTGDYRVLDRLCRISESYRVPMPRVRKLKKKDAAVMQEIQANFHAAMKLLYEFWSTGSKSIKADLLETIHKHGADVVAIERSVKDFDQGDLF